MSTDNLDLATWFSLAGRHAVVTGGAGGLGLGIAEGLARAGAQVVLIDSAAEVQRAAAGLVNAGLNAQALRADLGDRQQLATVADQAQALLGGRVDILVNNAGYQVRAPALQLSVEQWDGQLEVNLTACFLLAQRYAPGMVERGHGKIINLASIRSFVGSHNALAYAVSKGGIAQLTRSLSNELAPTGVQVNAIAPGYMDTALTAQLTRDSELSAQALQRVPAGRWGKPGDVQGLAVFLASAASDYVSGAIIPCDGGFLAH